MNKLKENIENMKDDFDTIWYLISSNNFDENKKNEIKEICIKWLDGVE